MTKVGVIQMLELSKLRIECSTVLPLLFVSSAHMAVH